MDAARPGQAGADRVVRPEGTGAEPQANAERLLAGILDSAAAGIAVLSGPELRFDLVNAAYRALTPRPELDPVGLRYDEVWPEEGPVERVALRRVRDTREPCHMEDYAFADRGGVRRFSFHVKAVPWRGGDALLVVLWETTALWEAKRQAEEAAEREAHRASELEAILAAQPDALVLYGRQGEILRMNAAAERLMAIPPGERGLPLVARPARWRLFSVANRALRPEDWPEARALRGETVRSAHLRVEGEGASGWILASAAPIVGPDGAPSGAVFTFSDESELHDLEAARDDLVRMVSHDLRTPLNAILAQAHLMRRQLRDPERVEQRALSIARSCERMRSMIQDLLEATLLEAGQLRMAPVELDLIAFTLEVLERHRGALPVHRVRVEAAPPVPARADPERLERILVNLVSNALKYSPGQGEVTIRAERAEGGALLAVSDRGVGIAPEDLPHVFERFFRARGARQPEGLGLGLYITRLLVYAHGGCIDVESQLGCGSTFEVFLPAAPPLPTPPPQP
jgi:signal transduction histidine kinase